MKEQNVVEYHKLFELAENHLFGRNGKCKDQKFAVICLHDAADRGQHSGAQAVLGFCYEFGIGVVSINFQQAERYYIMSIRTALITTTEGTFSPKEDGNTFDKLVLSDATLMGIIRLAFLRKYGRPGVQINRIESEYWESKISSRGPNAIAWIRRTAVEDHCSASQYCLGVCYHDGITVLKNEEEAFKWYERSAEQGNARGQGIIGYCYGEGFGVGTDEAKAMKYYRLAAAQGETVAIYNIGYCFEDGLGVEKDMIEAVKWYTLAAEQGNAFAQNSLGYCYEDGIGVQQDFQEAAKWYKLSANQGYPWAQCNLGYCNQNGIGLEKNTVEGAFW
jgi:TPR repeat protein